METRIPKIFHFCYFGGREFGLLNYLAVKSAHDVNEPTEMKVYFDTEPSGDWWNKAKKYLTLVPVAPINDIFGVPVDYPEAKSDITRLNRLIGEGGIYLDLDVICVKAFEPLLNNELVLGKEVYKGSLVGLGSAVILASLDSRMLKRWIEGFDPARSLWKGFRSKGHDQYYSEIAIKYPNFLSMLYPEEVHVEDWTSFYNPNYESEKLEEFFTTNSGSFENSYCHHLWASASEEKYLKSLTIEEIMSKDTTFNLIARRFL